MTRERIIGIEARLQAIKEIASNACSDVKDYENIEKFCDEIYLLEQEPRWVPVSKRLPEKSGKYWCTFGGTNLTGSDYFTTESDAKETFVEPREHIGWQSQNVIAWMPLPKPYRTESKKVNK